MKVEFSNANLNVIVTFKLCSIQYISGSVTTIIEIRKGNNFTAITALGNSSSYTNYGVFFKVGVKSYDNLFQYDEIKLMNSTLQLGYLQNINIKKSNKEFCITLPKLNTLSQYYSEDITATNQAKV